MTRPDDERTAAKPRPATRATRLAVGTAMMAGERVRGDVRAAGDRSLALVVGLLVKTRNEAIRRTGTATTRVRDVIVEAERRGQESLAGGRQEANALADGAVQSAVAWAQVKVVPQIIDDLVPHIISDVMPRLIDGALPEIKARVIPALLDDLTNDPQIRELILSHSRGVMGQVTEQLRTGTSNADDRFEATAHRLLGRNDKTVAAGSKNANDIRKD
jgi:hypothetical protein